MDFDLVLLKFFNNTISNPAFDFFFKYIGDFRIWCWPLGIILVLLLWKGGAKARWLIALILLTVALVDPMVSFIFKPLFARLRPSHNAALADWLIIVGGRGGKYGFPSSHAANLASQAYVIGCFYKSSRYYLYPLAFLICISRMYLGVHYPSDVLAGAVYGAVIGFAIIYAAKHFRSLKIGRHLEA